MIFNIKKRRGRKRVPKANLGVAKEVYAYDRSKFGEVPKTPEEVLDLLAKSNHKCILCAAKFLSKEKRDEHNLTYHSGQSKIENYGHHNE